MTLIFFIKTCFNKGAAAATGCLSLLGAVYLPSAPRGLLIDQNALKALKSSGLFDCTRNGTPLALWLEHVDKAIYANPSVSEMWQGFSADDTPLAEQSLPRKLADLANVTINNLSARSGSASNVRLAAEQQLTIEIKRMVDDYNNEGHSYTKGLEVIARTGYLEKVLDAILTTVDGDAKMRIKELGVHRFSEIRDEMIRLYFRKEPAHKENNGSCDGPLWQLAPAPGSPGECGRRWIWQNPQAYKVQVQIQSPSQLAAASNSLASQLTSIAGNNIARHDIFTRARCAPPMGPGARC